MDTNPPQAQTQRFQLPVTKPLRELLIASLSATVGSFEIIAWATLRLGRPLLLAGLVLVLIGVGYGVWCLVRIWRTRWVVRLTADELIVTRGSRQRRLRWPEIGDVRVRSNRVEILDARGRKQLALGVDRTRRAHEMLQSMLAAIDGHRSRP